MSTGPGLLAFKCSLIPLIHTHAHTHAAKVSWMGVRVHSRIRKRTSKTTLLRRKWQPQPPVPSWPGIWCHVPNTNRTKTTPSAAPVVERKAQPRRLTAAAAQWCVCVCVCTPSRGFVGQIYLTENFDSRERALPIARHCVCVSGEGLWGVRERKCVPDRMRPWRRCNADVHVFFFGSGPCWRWIFLPWCCVVLLFNLIKHARTHTLMHASVPF